MAIIRDSSQPPLLEPPSTWTPYVGPLPALSSTLVALDVETRDEGLARDAGPGWYNRNGHIAGVSAAWRDSPGSPPRSMYLPLRHPSTECRDSGEVMAWVEEILRSCPVVFHRMDYDMGWLRASGVRVWPTRANDTYIMSVMLDENWESYSLDACCQRAGVPGKDEWALRNAAAAYGVDPKKELWRLPARHVGPYAEQDAVATLDLLEALTPAMEAERLWEPYRTEIAMVEVLHHMRMRGMRVDLDAADRVRSELRVRRQQTLDEISRLAGRRVSMEDVNSGDRLGPILDTLGVSYGRTPKTGKPKIDKLMLERMEHPVGQLIRDARKLSDMAEKFVGTYIMEFSDRGRIHAEIHQLRDDEGGTRSHRLSYANPPLQQSPARDEEMGPMFRTMFPAEPGEWWCAADYASQEPRWTVHFASITRQRGAEEMVRYFVEDCDPSAAGGRADLHSWNARLIGWPRKRAKDVYQAMAYGAQPPKLASMLGVTLEESRPILASFNRKLPWIEGLTGECSRLAQQRGWIKLCDGARLHFPLYEPVGRRRMEREGRLRGIQQTSPPLRLEQAQAMWPGMRLERAQCYKAMNRLSQGSSARQTKRAMVAAHRAGLPLAIQMHDELGMSVSDERAARQLEQCMVEAVTMVVPVRVDLEFGRSWGDAKRDWESRGEPAR